MDEPPEPDAALLRAVVRHAPLLLAWHGPVGSWHSPAVGRTFGVPDGVPLPGWLVAATHPDDQPAATALLRGAPVDEPTELRLRDRDGAWRVLAFTRRDLADPAGTVYCATDVTGNPTALAALSGLKAEFLAVVSHELRTPLTSIASLVELLGRQGLSAPDAGAAMATVLRNTARMLSLVDDLNLLADLESGGHRGPLTLVDLADLVRDAAGAVRDRHPGLSLSVSVPPGPPVDGDPRLLSQLLHAVLGALAMLAPTGPVTVTGAVDGLSWRLVADAAGGLPGTAERLLTAGPEAQVPAPDAQPYARSAAMSLLLARAIASSHGGRLGVAHEPDGRTVVTVWLPGV